MMMQRVKNLQRLWPRSLFVQQWLLLAAGMLIALLLSLALAWQERGDVARQLRQQHWQHQIVDVIQVMERVDPVVRPSLLSVFNDNFREVTLSPPPLALNASPRWQHRLQGMVPAAIVASVRAQLQHHEEQRVHWVSVVLSDGTPLTICLRAPPLRAPLDLPLYWAVLVLCLAVLAWVSARLSTRPLQRLIAAAKAVGENPDCPPLPSDGRSEMSRVAEAFNHMQARIRQHMAERVELLAAISHDLQTPLTRLRLRLEWLEDETLKEKMEQDINTMYTLIREGLAFARSLDAHEPIEPLDFSALLASVVADAVDTGQTVRWQGEAGVRLRGRPLALRRCLTNLIDNAVKYGQVAQVTLTSDAQTVCVSVRDQGAGLPPEELTKVGTPFYRVEASRNRETGGTGLGLATAKRIVLQHGGELRLDNHPEGGLWVQLRLPRTLFDAKHDPSPVVANGFNA